jgi:hypothetical protein
MTSHLSRRARPRCRAGTGRRAVLVLAACACLLASVLVSGTRIAGAAVPRPTVTPAIGGGGVPLLAGFTSFAPAAVGYTQSEVFLSGTATAYQAAGTFGTDGRFDVTPASTAAYTTRAVVMRPTDPARFNGTVVVEWLNVTGGADAAADWMMGHNGLIREGFAWVGVSAQKVGADALESDQPVLGVRVGDPVRYANLSHPGDSYSYDIYSQAAQAIRDEPGTFLGGLTPEHVLGIGESQSAGRLVTYIDAVHPVAGVYDGFLVHSRFAGGAPLSQAPQPAVAVPSPTPIRDDLDEPVLVFQAEGDVSSSLLQARQPDSDMFRLWEVPGTAHFDLYGLNIGLTDIGDGQGAVKVLQAMRNPTSQPNEQFDCGTPINTGPMSFVLNAAFQRLDRWVAEGVAPPTADRLQTIWPLPVIFATDAHGNVLGGVRTPAVDVPLARLSGQAGTGGNLFCFLFGTTTPFTPEELAQLYPDRGQFLSRWMLATVSAWEKGFLTAADGRDLINAAFQTDIGR